MKVSRGYFSLLFRIEGEKNPQDNLKGLCFAGCHLVRYSGRQTSLRPGLHAAETRQSVEKNRKG
jgi:hypothetical protein